MFSNAYVLLMLATFGWGGNAVAGKLATSGWEPFTLTCVRWLLVVLVLLPFTMKALRNDKPIIIERFSFFMGAGASMAGFNLLMYLALNYTTAINVSIEQATMPMFIILANFVVLSQRVTILQIAGVLISVVGVLVITSSGDFKAVMQNGMNRGDVIMLFGCMFYAVYTFVLRWRPKVHWLTFMTLIAFGAFLTSLPFAVYELSQKGFEIPELSNWALLVYVVLIPSLASQLAFARGVEILGSNRAGLFINLVPLFGSMFAVLLIGEQFQIFHALGMAFIIGGIMLAERFALAEN